MSSPDSPPPPPPPPPRRLTRSADERMLAGVAGGIARHFDLDPSLVRIAFAVLAVFGGVGLAIYAVCALVVPAQEGSPPLSTGAKVLLGIVALAALAAIPFAAPGFGGLVVVAAIVVVIWRMFGGRPDSRLLRASILVLAVIGSIVLGLGAGAAAAFGGGTAVAVAAVVAGAALVVGGFMGGARWLVVPALMLAVPASVVSAADLELEGGVGDREYRPVSVSDLRPEYRLGVGELRVDLRDLDLEPRQQVDLDVRVGLGYAEVTVPEDACVIADGHAGLGSIDILGRVNDGADVDNQRGGEPPADAPVVRIDMHAGVGELVVDRTPRRGHGFDHDFDDDAPLDDGCDA